ncbi:MAG: hypothetical protein ABJO02_00230 [Reichenbachiella sp.]|uniref:hypothetical protein n=1 Tax=Reichenbachiella sp. TaxID=2184521 RepID=UPI00329A0181
MLKLEFKSPQSATGVVKATVHKSGKLGFSSGAAKVLGLSTDSRFKVAVNTADEEDKNLYLVESEGDDKELFKVSKAGQYYFIRIKHILDEMGVDYRDGRIIYDIVNEENEGMKYYKLVRRK